MIRNKLYILLFLSIIFMTSSIQAQGDGSRMLLWGPTGVTSAIPKWMSLDQNMTPANILVEGADLHINAFPITVVHNFGIKGLFAQVMINAVPGNVTGNLSFQQNNTSTPTDISVNSSGFSDGFIGFKLGLINQPALNIKEYATYQKKTFSMMSYTRVWYSGTYNKNDPMNLGSNRITFEIGFPIDIFLSNKNPKRPTWLEIYPAIHLYTANNDPTTITGANKTQQLPLFTLENHLSHNFTDKFWAGIDLRYQYGGDVKADGVKQEDLINALGGGATLGYQIIPPLGINMSYGHVFNNPSNVDAKMFKVTAVFSYFNKKKLN